MNVFEKLLKVQSELKAPKNQYNNFGKYSYRSCEDIFEGVKPLLKETSSILNVTDEIVLIGERYYIKATAIFIDTETGEKIQNSAYAREDETKKGMDLAQVTGSVSSYARKYALNGLFCIDDTKDADFTNTKTKENKPKAQTTTTASKLSTKQLQRLYILAKNAGYDNEKVKQHMETKFGITSSDDLTKEQYDIMCNGYLKMNKEIKQ